MVTSVSPNYYALQEGVSYYPYSLEGSGFDAIPSDAVGLVASDNFAPLANRYNFGSTASYQIVTKTENEMQLRYDQEHIVSVPVYLGAIVSADRETVYWVNNSRPLP